MVRRLPAKEGRTIGALTVVATVLSSGVVAALVSFFLALRRDLHLSRQQKAEQLFIASTRYYRDVGGVFVGMLPVIKDGGPISEMSSLMEKSSAPDAGPQAEMLIKFYFPSVLPAWQRLEAARAGVVKAMAEYHHGRGDVHLYDSALAKWQPAGEALQEAIVSEGRKYATYEPWKGAMSYIKTLLPK